jgi:hypothetical protein
VDSKVDTISPEARHAFWNQDEIVESPEFDDAQQTTSRFAQRATRRPLSCTSSSSRMHRGGALVSAFQHQQQMAATQYPRPDSNVDTVSPEARRAFWNQDEIVESPEFDDAQQTTSQFAQRATRRPQSRTMHRGGALVSAFQHQEQMATTQSSRPASSLTNNPFPRIGSKSSKKQSVRPSPENFFKPARQRGSRFSQLEINVREPDDGF